MIMMTCYDVYGESLLLVWILIPSWIYMFWNYEYDIWKCTAWRSLYTDLLKVLFMTYSYSRKRLTGGSYLYALWSCWLIINTYSCTRIRFMYVCMHVYIKNQYTKTTMEFRLQTQDAYQYGLKRINHVIMENRSK